MAIVEMINLASTLNCIQYTLGYSGSQPEHIGHATYKDCDGFAQSLTMTYSESGGNYYTITICASETPEYDNYIQMAAIDPNYDCTHGQAPTINHSVIGTGIAGDDVTVEYTAGDNSRQTRTMKIPSGQTSLRYDVCAQENTVQCMSNNCSEITVVGPCDA